MSRVLFTAFFEFSSNFHAQKPKPCWPLYIKTLSKQLSNYLFYSITLLRLISFYTTHAWSTPIPSYDRMVRCVQGSPKISRLSVYSLQRSVTFYSIFSPKPLHPTPAKIKSHSSSKQEFGINCFISLNKARCAVYIEVHKQWDMGKKWKKLPKGVS